MPFRGVRQTLVLLPERHRGRSLQRNTKCHRMLAALLLSLMAAGPPAVQVQTLSGESLTGTLVEFGPQRIGLETAHGRVTLETERVASLAPAEVAGGSRRAAGRLGATGRRLCAGRREYQQRRRHDPAGLRRRPEHRAAQPRGRRGPAPSPCRHDGRRVGTAARVPGCRRPVGRPQGKLPGLSPRHPPGDRTGGHPLRGRRRSVAGEAGEGFRGDRLPGRGLQPAGVDLPVGRGQRIQLGRRRRSAWTAARFSGPRPWA